MANNLASTTRLSTTSEAPAHSGTVITPSDSAVIGPFRGLYVGVGGNVAALLVNDAVSVTFLNVANGTLLPIAFTKILSTGTTATSMLGLA